MIGLINGFIGGLSKIKIPDWVPKVGGLSFSLPKIPKLAGGGVAFDDTLAVVGDNPNARVDPEVIAPLSKLETMLGLNLAGAGGDTRNYNVYVTGNTISSENIDSIGNLGKEIAWQRELLQVWL